MIPELKKLLGSDWTWDRDVVGATTTVRHRGGLWFEIADETGEAFGRDVAEPVSKALLDAVEDGIKGLVRVDCTWNHQGITVTIRPESRDQRLQRRV